jgi:hypothetical protein
VVGVLLVGLAVLLGMAMRPPASLVVLSREVVTRQVPPRHFVSDLDVATFLRGDIHAHSSRSDGDSPAEVVMAWYRAHGYQFLALTDHNRHLDASDYKHMERDNFVLLPAEEVSMAAVGKPIHVNALCTKTTIGEARFDNRIVAVQWAVDQIGSQGGVALINHPNFVWSLKAEHLAPVRGARMVEIYSGHPQARSDGNANHPSVEQIWDELLALGSTLVPAAVDDMHMLGSTPIKGIPQARPGTGWVEVYGAELTRDGICRALADGRLFASNGPRLDRLSVTGNSFTLWIAEGDAQVDFIGMGGEVLATVHPEPDHAGALHASYQLRGDETFVRARVVTQAGRAWTKAYRTTR